MNPTHCFVVSDCSNDINRELNAVFFDELVVVLDVFNNDPKMLLILTRIGSRSAITKGGI